MEGGGEPDPLSVAAAERGAGPAPERGHRRVALPALRANVRPAGPLLSPMMGWS